MGSGALNPMSSVNMDLRSSVGVDSVNVDLRLSAGVDSVNMDLRSNVGVDKRSSARLMSLEMRARK